MSNARHHLEWLNLVDISGPFLSLNVLMEVFPNGLDPHQPELVKQLRQAYSEWQASQEQRVPDVTIQHLWLEYVFDKVLGFDKSLFLRDQAIADRVKVELPQHRETLKPDYLLVNPKHQDSNKIRLVVQTYPSTQHLGKSIQGRSWSATPADRMRELLKAYNLQLGLVTNGKQWMLISTANEEATGYISWYANFWLEEPITLRAFRSLLAQERFFAVAENNTLEAMLSRSADAQQEVTNRLGYQVREAVQIIIQTIDRIDKDRHRELLFNISEKELYEAALTVMMRLVFLFYAEERELIVMSGESIYEDNYAVSTLREQLRKVADEHGEELLERRYDAWMRLLATFRAVYDGVRHQDFQLPAYGGRLFDPDRFPFLEGRTSQTSWKQTRANPIP
ncbi:MAG: hypothetical protein JNN15_21090, partial [Blastocatellia bacterium]|nr:hypothetical protein [Blastocatellia bacterium]